MIYALTDALKSQVAFTCLVYPCLIFAYMGEAAFLSKHHHAIQDSFYKAIPGKKLFQESTSCQCYLWPLV